MSERLLLALQPESTSDALVAQGIAWAARLGLRLDLCSALPIRVSTDPLHTAQSVLGAATDAVDDQRRIGDWLADLLSDVPVALRGDAHVLLGEAVPAIREAAESARVLAIGSHHRRDITRLLLGSVSEKLVQTATVPVLVLPTSEAPSPTETLRVHLPLDPAEPDFRAIEWARDHLGAADLTAVFRLSWLETFGPLQGDITQTFEEARERLRVALMDAGYGDMAYTVIVREETHVAEALAAEAETSHVDLLAMPTHGRTGIAHLLRGSVSERVVRAATCAVLVVH